MRSLRVTRQKLNRIATEHQLTGVLDGTDLLGMATFDSPNCPHGLANRCLQLQQSRPHSHFGLLEAVPLVLELYLLGETHRGIGLGKHGVCLRRSPGSRRRVAQSIGFVGALASSKFCNSCGYALGPLGSAILATDPRIRERTGRFLWWREQRLLG